MTIAAAAPADIDEGTAGEAPKIRTAIGILVTRFPLISEAFILREINELERQGQPLLLIPLIRQRAAVMHEEAKPWLRRAVYTPFLSMEIVRSNLKVLMSRPSTYLSMLWKVVSGSVLHPTVLIRNLALFPKAVHLSQILPGEGIRHLHAHFATHPATVAWIISSLSDITFSFSVHASDIFLHRVMLREKIAAARFIRSVSTFNKAFLCGLYPGIADNKVQVVHAGIAPEVYAEASAAAERQGRPLIVCVATFRAFKGIQYLVEACARLRQTGLDFQCRIAGDGYLRPAIAAMIEERHLGDVVQLTGALPQHEIARLLAACDVFVLPSMIARNGLMDGIPISLMEAMAAGRPVVGSALSGIPELVEHGVNGILVDATNSDQLAEAIRGLVDDPQLRERMGLEGMKKVQREFDIRGSVRSMMVLLDRWNATEPEIGDRIGELDWTRLGTRAVGIRKIHDRRDSTVAEVTAAGGIHPGELIIKQQKSRSEESRPASERASHEHEVLIRLRRTMAAASVDLDDGVEYGVPRAIHLDERAATVVMQRARGRALDSIVREARVSPPFDRKLAPPLVRTGTWLRLLQRSDHPGDARQHLQSLILRAGSDLQLASAADPGLRRRRKDIESAIRACERSVLNGPLRVVGHHGDFWPGNIYVSERSVEVIDFEGFRQGLPLEDVGYFLVQLELFFAYPLFHAMFPPLADHFLEGYAAARKGDLDRDALRLCTMAKALQIVASGVGGMPGRAGDAWRRRVLRRIVLRQVR